MPRLIDFRGFIPYITIVFLNAFVDLGHKIVIQNTVFKVYDGQTQVVLTALVNALILIPFVLLFSPSGFLSDRYPKAKVIRYSAGSAIVATLLITACYYAGWFWAAFTLTLALAIQSAFYSPAKYGYIKELVGKEPLARANGAVQSVTIVAILLGTFVFSALFERLLVSHVEPTTETLLTSIAPLGWGLVALSVLELALCYFLPTHKASSAFREERVRPEGERPEGERPEGEKPPAAQGFNWHHYLTLKYLKRNLSLLREKASIWQSIIGLAVFWAISQVVLAAFPAFAKVTLGETNTVIIQGILACTGFGIIAGSLLAARVSRNHIETGLIPISALGITLALALLPNLDSRLAMAATFLVLGLMGGLFIVPLNAMIQFHARESQLGTVLAGNNWVQNIAMLLFLLLTVVSAAMGVDSQALFAALAFVALVGTGHTVRKLPHSFARIVVSLLFRQRYKIDVEGFKHLPSQEAVLLLGNHVSWIDWALVQIACPRPIHFVMLRDIYNRWYLKPILKAFGAIPIARGHSAEALATVNKLLKDGEVVCLFPEGALTLDGKIGKFHSGYERTVEGIEKGVIVPFYLDGLWGSAFTHAKSGSGKSLWRRRDLTVAFGETLPLSTKAEALKQKVSALSPKALGDYNKSTICLAAE